MKTELSPAVQAVMDAYVEEDRAGRLAVAAVLRAAADQVVPREAIKDPTWTGEAYKQRQDTRAELLAIAAELESPP